MKLLRLLKVLGPTYDLLMDVKRSRETSKVQIPSDEELLQQVFSGDLVPEIKVEVNKILDTHMPPSKEQVEQAKQTTKVPKEIQDALKVGEDTDEPAEKVVKEVEEEVEKACDACEYEEPVEAEAHA